MMNLGVAELVVLGVLCFGGIVLVAGVVVLVAVLRKKKGAGGPS